MTGLKRRSHRWHEWRAVSVACVLIGLMGAGAEAQQVDSLHACYVPDVGAIYMIRLPGTPTECLPNHEQVSWTRGSATDTLLDGSVITAKLADRAVTAVKLADGSVVTLKLADSAVTSVKLGVGAVGSTQLADSAVTSVKLGRGAVGTPQLADGAVTAAKLASDAGPTDHGALGGLTDDDHPQYLLLDGVRSATNGFAVTGTQGTGTIPATGVGDRFMWYPRKTAFRVGGVGGTEWDDSNTGYYSTAMGSNTIASGYGATAIGENAVASGDKSMAMGYKTTASAGSSVAMGEGTDATGYGSVAMGYQTSASGAYSTAMGIDAMATGQRSSAIGDDAVASGNFATAIGRQVTAQAFNSLVIGFYNQIEGTQGSWVSTEPLFVAGNGSTLRSNALTLYKNGNLTIAGTLSQSSDIRQKENVQPLERALERLLQLTPIRYRFREGTGHPTDLRIGLSAQEVEKLFPELVTRDSQGYMSVAYTDLAAVLLRAIQEQQAQIESLRATMSRLVAFPR